MPNNLRDDMDSCTVKVIGLYCAKNSNNQKIISKIAA